MKKDVYGLGVTIAPYDSIRNSIVSISKEPVSDYVCFANVHMLVEAQKDARFARVVNNSKYTVADGVPLVWSIKSLYHIKQDRVAGMDLLPDILADCQQEQIPVFFYGGTNDMLDRTGEYLHQHYPGIQVAGMYSPPFRRLTSAEEDEVATRINASNAKVIFVVLGCPKQEKWMHEMKGRINGIMLGIGAALPVLVGMQKRAPQWMRRNGLEWLYRLCQEPKRLFKRYFITNGFFILLVIKHQLLKVFGMQVALKPTVE